MVSSLPTFIGTLALVASTIGVQEAQAHTYLTQPLAEFKAGASKSSWVAEFQPPWTGTFKTGAQYAAVAPGKGFKDLRSFLESKGPACGNSLSSASPKAIPSDGKISLASTIEHAGPCEVWLDDTMAFHNDDCEKTFGSATSFSVDFSSCKGSCMLRFYWLGLQDGGKRWQSYKNCVPLGGGGGGGGGGGSSTTPAKTTKAPKTSKPKKTAARSMDSEYATTYEDQNATSFEAAPAVAAREEFSFADLHNNNHGN